MPKKIDMTGRKCGRLTVIREAQARKDTRATWVCECVCGTVITVTGKNLRTGHTKSCGCLHKDRTSEASTTHGLSDTRFYHIWENMKRRCYKEGTTYYENYGGRGIKVCDRWHDFEEFKSDMYASYLEHADEYGEVNTSIDRIDSDGNYEPSNCRFATRKEQAGNRRPRREVS